MPFEPKKLLLAIPLLTLSAVHVTYSARNAYAVIEADRDTPASLHHATQLAPANAANYARLGALEPENASKWLDIALRLNPVDPLLWIEKGVNQEVAGDPAAAERSLLEAARLDHQYVPRWTLAAFYFRQRNVPQFQHWARQALEMAWGDALPLFQMAGNLEMSLADVRRTMLPDRAPVLSAFISECIRRKDLDEAARAAHDLVKIGSREYRSIVLVAADALFNANRTSDAVSIWNEVVSARWIPHQKLGLIANPDFSFDFVPAAFDWRPATLDGVVFWRLGNGRGLQIEFSGRQPETCTLLTLPLPLEPKHSYKIHTETTASGFEKDTGLKWHLGAAEWEAAEPETQTIETPDKPQPLSLTLVYTRALGTKRMEGTLTVNRVTIPTTDKKE